MSTELEALQRSPRHVARWQRAQQDLLRGRPAAALDSYHELVKRFPGIPGLWFELGLAAGRQLNFDLADQAFQRAASLAPADISMLVLLGQQYHQLRRLEKARACFERAASLAPSSIHAQLSLADWLAREGRLDEAWECIAACAARHPHDAQVQCVKALLLHRKRQNTEAEILLRELIKSGSQDPNVAYSSRHQLAVVLDELGNYSEAIRWLAEAKTVLRRTSNVAKMEQDYDRAVRRRRELVSSITSQALERWRRNGRPATDRYRLVFLGGHPRSGTTLLEQILGVHPGIAAFDEPMAFVQEVAEKLTPLETPSALTAEALDTLPVAQCTHFQQRYLKSLLREDVSDPGVELLLDKNPSTTALLHLWLRIFPVSKVIVALRDPRDVVVSCFFQNLLLNTTNANFLSFERTAAHYADLMDVWLRLRELGGFDWVETRYEDIVGQLEREGRRITGFLGLSWHPHQARHYETARKKFVFAPTYVDVAQPVHSRAVGRWQHYAEALAPVQERLGRYCRTFGYA